MWGVKRSEPPHVLRHAYTRAFIGMCVRTPAENTDALLCIWKETVWVNGFHLCGWTCSRMSAHALTSDWSSVHITMIYYNWCWDILFSVRVFTVSLSREVDMHMLRSSLVSFTVLWQMFFTLWCMKIANKAAEHLHPGYVKMLYCIAIMQSGWEVSLSSTCHSSSLFLLIMAPLLLQSATCSSLHVEQYWCEGWTSCEALQALEAPVEGVGADPLLCGVLYLVSV